MKKKHRFFIEYQSGGKEYNYSVKSTSEKDALKKFDKIWDEQFEGVYPFPSYQIISVKKIMSEIDI